MTLIMEIFGAVSAIHMEKIFLDFSLGSPKERGIVEFVCHNFCNSCDEITKS